MTVNVQRNLHHNSAANFKNGYGEKCAEAIPEATKVLPAIRITYTLHMEPTKGKPTKALPYRGSVPKNIDLVNLLAVVDKVNADELVKAGHISDDTLANIYDVHFKSNNWATRNYILVEVAEVSPQPDPRLKETICLK